jgi:hypothetical protein
LTSYDHLVLRLEPVEPVVHAVELAVDALRDAVYGVADDALDVRKDHLAVELGQNRESERGVRERKTEWDEVPAEAPKARKADILLGRRPPGGTP